MIVSRKLMQIELQSWQTDVMTALQSSIAGYRTLILRYGLTQFSWPLVWTQLEPTFPTQVTNMDVMIQYGVVRISLRPCPQTAPSWRGFSRVVLCSV